MKTTFLDVEDANETIQGSMHMLMNAKVRVRYKTLTGNKTNSQIEGEWRFKDLLSEFGISGPGKADPEIEIGIRSEGGQELNWDKLTEIKGIGEGRAEEIREVLTGEA